ncbi:D-alanyl-D-alanine carboxypeptidase [Ahrensia sp. R2A130]|uniref:D-alanyl-D-alanine carboxypeptidase n=1 Tax=Ahrensia sp. R2A130 TaxID=744979 RepID=UPI0001E0BC14|nr:D-alanyl-D-alanine carboxypeptidase [Ahrensia sp. R2A130]EFL90167.1 peptidase S11, D-alanyl-D-alanine carboxypeptidase 1 [Ahrensia sp. R2A130]
MRTVFGSTSAAAMRLVFTLFLSTFLVLSFQLMMTGDAEAKRKKKGNPRYAAYVIDAKTGKVIFSRNGNARRYPASLTKMMTLYLVFEDMKAGRINGKTRLVMSKKGSLQQPSKIGLRAGQSISMDQAVKSLITKSANDVATAIGGQLSGSEVEFAKRMTRKARQLGMSRTTFKNANGLTARGQVTTAADMAKLGMALREHFPRKYKLFSTRVFKLGKRRYGNHNKLLGRVRGVDGIKTGYTRASGFNLVSSVQTGGRSIVAVVMGGRSGRSRNAHMQTLIKRHLRKASRGKQRRVVARATGSRGSVATKKVIVAKAVTPTPSPLAARSSARSPQQKISSRIATAHSAAAPKAVEIAVVNRKLKKLAGGARPVPVLRQTLPVKAFAASDPVRTAATPAPKGWQIQIAAAPNRDKAAQMLKNTQRKHRWLLGKNGKSLQPVRLASGEVLHRARFTGFGSQKSAVRACSFLKKKRTACIAIKG